MVWYCIKASFFPFLDDVSPSGMLTVRAGGEVSIIVIKTLLELEAKPPNREPVLTRLVSPTRASVNSLTVLTGALWSC